jgi:polysaccharide export outer membrane protein
MFGLLLLAGSLAGAQDQSQSPARPASPAAQPVFPTVFPEVQVAPPSAGTPKSDAVPPSRVAQQTGGKLPESGVPKTDATQLDSALRIGTGDLLETNVYNVPDVNTKARVGSNGDIYLPLVDYVHVAGLTLEEAAAVIEKRYAAGGFIKDPHVTLLVDEYESQGASVLGEITRPGVYPVLGGQRLFDLISTAGGYTDKAGHSITITHRGSPDNPVTVPFSRNSTDSDNNVDVFPGDMVLVHRADIVYVVGDVARPSGFLMDAPNLTVLKAVALAGGTNPTAKMNGAKIIRHGSNGVTETPVELKKILQAKAQDIPMQADDILFVPSSGRKVFTGKSVDMAAQLATAATIIAIH